MESDDSLLMNAEGENEPHPNHSQHGKNTAYHVQWGFRDEAAIWIDQKPRGLNFFPFATELEKWLERKDSNLMVFTQGEANFTNKYTYEASVLIGIFQMLINDGAEFADSSDPVPELEAELRRVRLTGEQLLYQARICEVLTKQLLFCTSFDEDQYIGAALGQLLSRDCRSCAKSKDPKHRISLLGSLAHHYRLCHSYENCLSQHVANAKKLRNTEASHSGVSSFSVKEIQETRKQYGEEMVKNGSQFIHMLGHISEIEIKMIEELEPWILYPEISGFIVLPRKAL